MKQKWDVTISKIGVIEVLAETKEDAMEIANDTGAENKIYWEDSWNVVDIQESV